jgi:hypothetical protein
VKVKLILLIDFFKQIGRFDIKQALSPGNLFPRGEEHGEGKERVQNGDPSILRPPLEQRNSQPKDKRERESTKAEPFNWSVFGC